MCRLLLPWGMLHGESGGRGEVGTFCTVSWEVSLKWICFKEVEAEILEEGEALGDEGNVSLSASSKLEVRRDEKPVCSKTLEKL